MLERPGGRDDEKPSGRHRRHPVRQPALDGGGAGDHGRGADRRGVRPHPRLGTRLADGIEATIDKAGLPWTAHRFWPRSGVTFARAMPRNAAEATRALRRAAAAADARLPREPRRLGRHRRRRADVRGRPQPTRTSTPTSPRSPTWSLNSPLDRPWRCPHGTKRTDHEPRGGAGSDPRPRRRRSIGPDPRPDRRRHEPALHRAHRSSHRRGRDHRGGRGHLRRRRHDRRTRQRQRGGAQRRRRGQR